MAPASSSEAACTDGILDQKAGFRQRTWATTFPLSITSSSGPSVGECVSDSGANRESRLPSSYHLACVLALLSGSPPLSGERPSPPQHQARLYSPRTPFAKRARRILRLALRLPYCRLRPSARVRQQTQRRETPSTRGSALRVAQKERGAKVRQRLDQNPSPG